MGAGSPNHVVFAGRDWVIEVHAAAGRTDYDRLDEAVHDMLQAGRDRVLVWSGEKAAQAFPATTPGPLQLGPRPTSFFFAYGGVTFAESSVADALARAWRDGADEVVFLSAAGREQYLADQEDGWQAAEEARYRVHPVGPRGRISPLAERVGA